MQDVSLCYVFIQNSGSIASLTTIFSLMIFTLSVSNLALVKPDKANAVENYLIQMARFGKLGGKVPNKKKQKILKGVYVIKVFQFTYK